VFSIIIAYSDIVRLVLLYLSSFGLVPTFMSNYFGWESQAYDMGVFHVKTVQQVIVVLFSVYARKRMPSHPSPYFTIIFNVYYLSTLSFILFSDFAIFSTRIGGFFYTVEPIFIIYLARYLVQKRYFYVALASGAVFIAYINYVYRAKLPNYEMFVSNVL